MITFPGDFKDVFFVKLPLNTSQIRHPNDHISTDLKLQKQKIQNMKKQRHKICFIEDIKTNIT